MLVPQGRNGTGCLASSTFNTTQASETKSSVFGLECSDGRVSRQQPAGGASPSSAACRSRTPGATRFPTKCRLQLFRIAQSLQLLTAALEDSTGVGLVKPELQFQGSVSPRPRPAPPDISANPRKTPADRRAPPAQFGENHVR